MMVVIVAMILGSLIYYCFVGFPSEFVADSAPGRLFVEGAQFDAGIVIAFIFCYIALFINQIGSVQSLGEFIGADKVKYGDTYTFKVVADEGYTVENVEVNSTLLKADADGTYTVER